MIVPAQLAGFILLFSQLIDAAVMITPDISYRSIYVQCIHEYCSNILIGVDSNVRFAPSYTETLFVELKYIMCIMCRVG